MVQKDLVTNAGNCIWVGWHGVGNGLRLRGVRSLTSMSGWM